MSEILILSEEAAERIERLRALRERVHNPQAAAVLRACLAATPSDFDEEALGASVLRIEGIGIEVLSTFIRRKADALPKAGIRNYVADFAPVTVDLTLTPDGVEWFQRHFPEEMRQTLAQDEAAEEEAAQDELAILSAESAESAASPKEADDADDAALLLSPLMTKTIDWLAAAAFILFVLGGYLWLLSGSMPQIGR